MNLKNYKLWLGALALVNATAAQQAFAAGFERSIMWGARSAGVAGIATPYITGSQAIYFNPAGLVGSEVGQDVSLNFSPAWSEFKAPINNDNAQATSETGLSPVFGVTYGNTFNERWAFGLGAYISGGNAAEYKDVAFTGYPDRGEVKTELQVVEFAAGAGYKVNDDLKLGAAWRVLMVGADFSFLQRSPQAVGTAVINAKLTDLEDTQYTGFKLGAQYRLAENTLLGFTYRSEVNLEVEGDATLTALTPLGPSPVGAGSAKAETSFPMAATLGIQHDLNESWRLLGEYAWTQYSVVDKIEVTLPAVGRNDLQLDWADQHNLRAAGEYLGTSWPIRFGYAWTSQVTDEAFARPTFSPPGSAHTVTLGTGQTFEMGGNPLQFDVAGEYTFASADGGTADAGATGPGTDIRKGTYEAGVYALHLGLTYAF